MKSVILQPDDFKSGMFVTVLDLKKTEPEEVDEGMDNPIQAIMMMGAAAPPPPSTTHLELLKGLVIRVDAINLPFVMATVFESRNQSSKKETTHAAPLDVRELNFMKLNEEYVNAYLGKGQFAALLEDKKFDNIQNIEGYETITDMIGKLVEQLDKESAKEKESKEDEN
jgi:hypothetical protein